MKNKMIIRLFALCIIVSFVSLLGIYFISLSLSMKEDVSQVINETGRQRMLMEKISKEVIQISYLGEEETRQNLEQTMKQFDDQMKIMSKDRSDSFLFDQVLSKQIKDIEVMWKDNTNDLQKILAGQEEPDDVTNIISRNNVIIANIEKVLESLEKKGNEHYEHLNIKNIVLILINLLFLIGTFVVWRFLTFLKRSEKKYKLLVENSPHGIGIYSDHQFQYMNKKGLEILKVNTIKEISSDIFKQIKQLSNEKHGEIIYPNGDKVYLEPIKLPLSQVHPEHMLILRDLTDKVKFQEKFSKINQQALQFKTTLDLSAIVAISNREGNIIYVNDKFCDLTKYKRDELIGENHRLLNSGYHPTSFFKELWNTILHGEIWKGEVKNKAKDGTYFWVHTIIIPFANDKGEPEQFMCIRYDITEKKQTEGKLKFIATHDQLTGLPNRQKFMLELQEKIGWVEENDSLLAVYIIELDRFKDVNDSLGHIIGDQLLIEVSSRLSKLFQMSSFFQSRLGGDEFAILMDDVKKEDVEKYAKLILQEIEKPMLLGDEEVFVTSSIGVCVYPEDGDHPETIMKNAGLAVNQSKEEGRNRYTLYSTDLELKFLRKILVEKELRKALDRSELTLYYQPKISINKNEIIGSEALLRWMHPTLGIISPTEFIPLAEETGMIDELGEWVIRTACLETKILQEEGYSNLSVAVNLSPYQFRQENLAELIRRILVETGFDAKCLELEITESISMYNYSFVVTQLKELKKLGVTIALDDFGTGYSSLSYLSKFPIDTLKIDRSFLISSNNKRHKNMVAAIIAMGKSLNMKVVAEGVETKEHLEFLRKQKCDIAQGYLISRPISYHHYSTWVSNYYKDLNIKHGLM